MLLPLLLMPDKTFGEVQRSPQLVNFNFRSFPHFTAASLRAAVAERLAVIPKLIMHEKGVLKRDPT
jgi:hypothetical protein